MLSLEPTTPEVFSCSWGGVTGQKNHSVSSPSNTHKAKPILALQMDQRAEECICWIQFSFLCACGFQTLTEQKKDCCCSVAKLCPTLWDPCSTPGFPAPHDLSELAQTHVHWVGDAIQPSHLLLPPSPPSLLGSSVHEILQAIILGWVAIPFSRWSSWHRDQTWISHIAGRLFTIWATWEAPGRERAQPLTWARRYAGLLGHTEVGMTWPCSGHQFAPYL